MQTEQKSLQIDRNKFSGIKFYCRSEESVVYVVVVMIGVDGRQFPENYGWKF
jgi:hypothetical protein